MGGNAQPLESDVRSRRKFFRQPLASVASNDGSFTMVTKRRRHKPKPVIGTSQSEDCASKATETRRPVRVFVTRLQPNTSVQSVHQYVNNKLSIQVKCEQLKSKYDTYSSFAIETTGNNHVKLLDASMWPTGILVRKYYPTKTTHQ